MVKQKTLADYCQQYLKVDNFADYCPNGLQVQHPFYDKQVPIILGQHITTDAGTGAVHTAPAPQTLIK